jgi:apolipoprotein N-acyltransferase
MYLGLALLLGTFALYATGLVSPAVPIEALPDYWTLSVHEYLEAINEHHLHRDHLITGWSWLKVVNFGDFLNLIGIAFLSAVTIFCYMAILPGLIRKKDWVFAAVAAAEILILCLAASGIVSVGH